MIATLEELSLNAFPALRTMICNGWIVRMSNGYSRRGNSVQTFRAHFGSLQENIAYCETLYRQYNLPVVFKMTAASQPSDLDQVLAARGYTLEGDTIVQSCALDAFSNASNGRVRISKDWDEEWYDAYCRMNQLNPAHHVTLKQMLQSILPETGYALLTDKNGAQACGLGVVQQDFVGLFDIGVDAGARRRGYGEQIVTQLMSWGKARGARTAYLQVVQTNIPALQLYAKLGFVGQYSYWYRLCV